MNKYIIGVLFCMMAFSCDDEADDNPFCERYEEGTLLIGMRDDVSVQQSFDLFNSYGLHIASMAVPYYESSLPGDSIQYVVQYLNSKEYINSNGFRAVEGGSVYLHYQTQALTVVCNFWNMTLENQQDWIETTSVLKLTEKPLPKSFVLTVPVGEEKKWVTTFKNAETIRWAELNCDAQIFPG